MQSSETIDQATDAENRLQALDPSLSFIVQAPAGSGKTSLLTQRFLRLLTTVNKPEEILAITFTKKAAGEMHQRIIEALKMAQKPKPAEPYLQQTWLLAAQALEVDAQNNWQLLGHSNRLRVQTIDSLCASLTKQMPVLARFGSQPLIETDCQALYEEAATAVLEELEGEGDTGDAVRLLVSHLDNQLNRAQELIAGMLSKRDQWLRHVLSSGVVDKEGLEEVLQNTIETGLARLSDALSDEDKATLAELLAFAARYIEPEHDLATIGRSFDFDRVDYSSHQQWQVLISFLLTNAHEYRKQASVKMGFPAQSAAIDAAEKELFKVMKKRYADCLCGLQSKPLLRLALTEVSALPTPVYSEQQWGLIQALMSVLPLAVAHLRLAFQQAGRVDFCEVSLSASQALQDSSGVTDIGLKLDYQLSHILLDEFQDTSETQYALLQDLVAGWQAGDGRSLFLVGDPMQSIYRFRQAEVGLFIKTQQQGLGEVEDVIPLGISRNFRSQAGVVEWVNEAFKQVMPLEDDIYSSAISYKPSIASQARLKIKAVNYYSHQSRQQEGAELAELIQSLQHDYPEDKIGVLVRSRKALEYLVAELNAAGQTFQASEIDPLAKRQTVIDLLSLTRACLQPADRIAWLAVLRAPWCGLSLDDLFVLVDGAEQANIIDLLKDSSRISQLSDEGQVRANHAREKLSEALNLRERLPLVGLIKGLWQSLLGPACLQTSIELQDAQRYLDCLAEVELTGKVDLKTLKLKVDKLFSAVDSSACDTLQIMTVHKSKGLEFDHVILPGLDRTPPSDKQPLLEWLERPSTFSNGTELLIGPIKETGQVGAEPISQYLGYIAKQKSLHESQRILYVAATRAKKSLHLSFRLKQNAKTGEPTEPGKTTLLGLLWPIIKDEVKIDFKTENEAEGELEKRTLRRLARPDVPTVTEKELTAGAAVLDNSPGEVNWEAVLATSVGTVYHHFMQLIGLRKIKSMASFDQQFPNQLIKNLLLESGLMAKQVETGTLKVKQLIRACLEDERGLWILDNHQESTFEYPLSGVIDGEVKHVRLDRTFVDKGVRWIVDYKTGQPSGKDRESFLNEEMQTYQQQLNEYGRLMSQLESLPVRLALYHPAISGWREWGYLLEEK